MRVGVTERPLLTHAEIKAARDVRREVKLRDPLKKVNKERKGQRVTEGRDPDYLDWVRKQPCVVCGLRTGEVAVGIGALHQAFVVAAHMKAGRTAETDQTALPVDDSLHREQHRIGIKSWAKAYRLDIPALIARHRKRYALEMAAKSKAHP